MSTRSPEREQFLADIIIGAVEGGTGYWACVSEYKHPDDNPAATYAVLHEALDDDDESVDSIEGGFGHYPAHMLAILGPPRYEAAGKRIDVDVAARGLSVLCAEHTGIGNALREANRENDAGQLDANDCDCIIQAGLFGQIVYG